MVTVFVRPRRGCGVVVTSFGLLCAGSAHASLYGHDLTTTSQVNMDPIESRTDTIVDPGVEIQYGDGSAFSWMIAGDSINVGPHGGVGVYEVDILLASTHTFMQDDDLTLTFTLPAPFSFDDAVITKAITVNSIEGSLNGDTLSLTIHDMYQVSQLEPDPLYDGEVEVAFTIVPAPGAVCVAGVGMFGLTRRRRRA